MATVAHESSPRTNQLAISGTLDGDAYITPNPVVIVPPRANPVEED